MIKAMWSLTAPTIPAPSQTIHPNSRALSFAASQAVNDDLVAVHENDELSC